MGIFNLFDKKDTANTAPKCDNCGRPVTPDAACPKCGNATHVRDTASYEASWEDNRKTGKGGNVKSFMCRDY